ncbi:aldose 1-epimerase family protein [Terrihabitans sp. B22-R8]|uniref:aldose 1-epimerase family protein n=1 Tax=Terrihabitans sp. B22-R8 TaxID=3425128 RepID=UPI00403C3D8B
MTDDPTELSAAQLRSAVLTADFSARGAQLVRLRDAEGRDLLWEGDPDVWGWHAPLLFPIVGRVAGDRIRVDGESYPMKQHGLARHAMFTLIDVAPAECRFRLVAGPETRRSYPFDFALDVVCRLSGNELTIEAQVTNAGQETMPVSFGFHPAFRWPLVPGVAREDHHVLFERDEPDGIRRLRDGLLTDELVPSPVRDGRLDLTDDLFCNDALVFDRPRSRSLVYGAGQGPRIRVSFPEMPHLGIWSKSDSEFVCLEPWHGHASPENFEGELRDKPGIVSVSAGDTARFSMSIAVLDPSDGAQ